VDPAARRLGRPAQVDARRPAELAQLVDAQQREWLAAPMKKSIGIENIVLMREAVPARAPRAAASGSACPPPATCSAERITICCAGQITNQTLYHMSVPSRPPVRMRVM
jgi:hypothetical protein